MANYHPSDDLLMQFAAGQAPNALGIIVACHIETCGSCAAKVRRYESLGGDILSSLEPEPVGANVLDNILARLDDPVANDKPLNSANQQVEIPRPLRRFVDKDFDQLSWSGFSSSIKEFVLPISDERYTAKFYRIAAGKELPEHTHEGNEFTLVMRGSFCDKAGDYHKDDFILADTQTVHQPRAHMEEDCICFAVMDAPLKMTGFFGRMLNPFLR
jgi:putative transcriptional regulator